MKSTLKKEANNISQNITINPDIKVNVVDINADKISAWNSKDLDNLPVYEPGLSKITLPFLPKNTIFFFFKNQAS